MSIFEKFKIGFKKSAENISSGFKEILLKKEIDDNSLNEIEEFLISSDVGLSAASEIRNILAHEKIDSNSNIVDEINKILKKYIITCMLPFEKKDFFKKKENLNVILVAGVNGSGKTTTIGKISKILKKNENKVVLSACDTFRAAAIEQLENWANRIKVDLVKSNTGSEPASVAYKSVEYAKKNNFDQLIIDTAGRLQNKKDLMEELTKTCRVLSKLDANAPHQKVVVLDGTVGQNAHSQLKNFDEAIGLTGMIVTKLDGSAKGGVVVSLAEKFNIPIHAVGVGEGVDDLQSFEASSFSKALVGLDD